MPYMILAFRDIAGFIYHVGKLHSLNIVLLFCTVIHVLVYMYVYVIYPLAHALTM